MARSTIALLASFLAINTALAQNELYCGRQGYDTCACYYPASSDVVDFEMPSEQIRMMMHIKGASGGAALKPDGIPDPDSRGLGKEVLLDMNDIPAGLRINIVVGGNGEDAQSTRSGRGGRSGEEVLSGGDGGTCPLNSASKRYAGGGGAAVAVTLRSYVYTFDILVAGGGGAGGYNIVNGTSKGGHAPAVQDYDLGVGEPGMPALLSGVGGGSVDFDKGSEGVNAGNGTRSIGRSEGYAGGNGLSTLMNTDYHCMAGGGSGAGRWAGSSGGAFGSNTNDAGAAGSGGSGASWFMQTSRILSLRRQWSAYNKEPSVMIQWMLPNKEAKCPTPYPLSSLAQIRAEQRPNLFSSLPNQDPFSPPNREVVTIVVPQSPENNADLAIPARSGEESATVQDSSMMSPGEMQRAHGADEYGAELYD